MVKPMEQEEKKQVKNYDVWSVKSITATTEPAFYNEETEEYLSIHEAIAKILNEIALIKKGVGGI